MRFSRPSLFVVLFFLFGTIITIRLWFLQIKKHNFYKALSEGQQKILEIEKGKRGEIFSYEGEPLAINKTEKYLFVSPQTIKEKDKTAKEISQILDINKDLVLEKIKKPNLFETIKHNLSEQEEKLIKEKELDGVFVDEETIRYYPYEETAGHIIGFLGGDNQGQYGIEGYYNEKLTGKEALIQKEKGPFGFSVNTKTKNSGENINLNVELFIQHKAEKLLSEAQESLGFKSGQILVMKPYSGDIVALAEVPTFNPNSYSSVEDVSIFQNSISQKIFEPGSVFKPITMAASINEKKITPQTTYIDNGFVKIGKYVIRNYKKKVWGKQTMTQVLEKSINTGAVFVEKQLGHSLFLDYIQKFGFFEKTGIDLQGEVYSENLEFKKGYEINFANASFGQGIEVTPIQLARAFAIIANGGKSVQPHLIKKNQDISSNPKQIISQETASQITTMLISVVENGFAKSAKVSGYYIAGKTGTAQVSWPALGISKKGYSDETIQTFVGFCPALKPEFLILVKLDNPKTRAAEYSAIPLFQKLAKYITDYWEIPPDYE